VRASQHTREKGVSRFAESTHEEKPIKYDCEELNALCLEEEKIYYRRHLPHFQPNGAVYHIVFRLTDSLPKNIIRELKDENDRLKAKPQKEKSKFYIDKIDERLGRLTNGNLWLKKKEIAALVGNAIHYRDGNGYDLLAYCIMQIMFILCLNYLSAMVGTASRPTELPKLLDR
jgi:hypothetical protein